MEVQKVPVEDDPIPALSDLTTDVVDVIGGYEYAVEHAESDVKPTLEKFLDIHQRHAAELMETVSKTGGHPDSSGSMMGAVHKAVVASQNWFGELDMSTLKGFFDGEERLLSSYDEAAAASDTVPEVNKVVCDQRTELKDLLQKLR